MVSQYPYKKNNNVHVVKCSEPIGFVRREGLGDVNMANVNFGFANLLKMSTFIASASFHLCGELRDRSVAKLMLTLM